MTSVPPRPSAAPEDPEAKPAASACPRGVTEPQPKDFCHLRPDSGWCSMGRPRARYPYGSQVRVKHRRDCPPDDGDRQWASIAELNKHKSRPGGPGAALWIDGSHHCSFREVQSCNFERVRFVTCGSPYVADWLGSSALVSGRIFPSVEVSSAFSLIQEGSTTARQRNGA